MSSCFHVPRLSNPRTVIRIAQNQNEIEAANRIVYRNYVGLYWQDDEEAFRKNKYLHSEARHTFVAVDEGRVIGTMSIIDDSTLGVPSDTFQPPILRRYRRGGKRVAELTSLAVEQGTQHPMSLVLFLYSFFMQYGFYHLGLDYLFASCRPNHAHFYVNRLCFEELTAPAPHAYAGNVACQLLVLDVAQAHLLLAQRYGIERTDNFYRFMLADGHPQVRLPEDHAPRRSRNLDWLAIAQGGQTPIAV
jgi:hypothetical protein